MELNDLRSDFGSLRGEFETFRTEMRGEFETFLTIIGEALPTKRRKPR
jgi:hypothetical protein